MLAEAVTWGVGKVQDRVTICIKFTVKCHNTNLLLNGELKSFWWSSKERWHDGGSARATQSHPPGAPGSDCPGDSGGRQVRGRMADGQPGQKLRRCTE